MKTTQHTPDSRFPYRVITGCPSGNDYGCYEVWTRRDDTPGSRNNYMVAGGIQTEADAQFIVTACNWHAEAKEALTEIALLCEQADCEADWQDILRRANSALEGLAKHQSAQGKE